MSEMNHEQYLKAIQATPVMRQLARSPQSVPELVLSSEQRKMIDVVRDGRDVIVDATVGAGKTASIQALCNEVGQDRDVLYLTYSKLLKLDAQKRVRGAKKVQNYHGVVYPSLLQAGIRAGISESIRTFNTKFKHLSANFPKYDLLVVDEYQDINEDYAQLLRNIKSMNPLMQTVMVGDMAQKVQANTTLNAQEFAAEFCDSPEHVPFTQSFRVGPELGALLSEAWDKPLVGVNSGQQVSFVSFDEAMDIIKAQKPGDLLCLGKRNGAMARALNEVEDELPGVFNKNTVYASIRDSDGSVTYGDDVAVFTTFDSSKGLERKVCVVFDYDEENWEMRSGFPNVDPEVLRNVFLVAASRGKDRVIFVRGDKSHRASKHNIGFIPVHRFTKLPDTKLPEYKNPLLPSECFDFTYAENVEACFDLLDVKRLDDGTAQVIDIERSEGLIDLSPVVGHYQEAAFFDDYDPANEVRINPKPIAAILSNELGVDPWRNSLVLTAVATEQMRYADQVVATIPDEVRDALVARLATQLPPNSNVQVPVSLRGTALRSRTETTPVEFSGIIDAIHDKQVFELKFVSELTHPMFLQLGLYLAMSNHESGVLWNTRTDERWRVQVPDRQRFLNAVVLCTTKQSYRVFDDQHTERSL